MRNVGGTFHVNWDTDKGADKCNILTATKAAIVKLNCVELNNYSEKLREYCLYF